MVKLLLILKKFFARYARMFSRTDYRRKSVGGTENPPPHEILRPSLSQTPSDSPLPCHLYFTILKIILKIDPFTYHFSKTSQLWRATPLYCHLYFTIFKVKLKISVKSNPLAYHFSKTILYNGRKKVKRMSPNINRYYMPTNGHYNLYSPKRVNRVCKLS